MGGFGGPVAQIDNRRESRLDAVGVSLWLRFADSAMICPVDNISRIGIAVRIEADPLPEGFPEIHVGSVLRATLKVADVSFSVGLKVLRVTGAELGCSLVFSDDESQRRLAAVLSPRFVAQSIVPVSPSVLGSHLSYAYYGADFWVLADRTGDQLRLGTSDVACTVVAGRVSTARSVDGDWQQRVSERGTWYPLSLPPAGQGEADERASVAWIVSVLDAWAAKPEDVGRATELLRATLTSPVWRG